MKKTNLDYKFFKLIAQKNDPSVSFALDQAEKAYQANLFFFEKPIPKFTIELICKRKEMDLIMHEKTPKWVAGTSIFSMKKVIIFSPSVFEKLTSHKMKMFLSVLTHEICHLFIHSQCPLSIPCWLAEGLACNVAKQGNPRQSLLKNVFFNDCGFLRKISSPKIWLTTAAGDAYQICFHWINHLLQKFGREKLINLMLLLNQKIEPDKCFEKVYNKSVQKLMNDFFTERR